MFNLKSKFVKVSVGLFAGLTFLWASGIAPQAYNLIEANGTPAARGSTLNFADGTGVTWACSTSAGVTTCTATGTGGGGGGTSNVGFYSQSFTSQTSVTLTDNAGTANKIAQCYDGSSPPLLINPASQA